MNTEAVPAGTLALGSVRDLLGFGRLWSKTSKRHKIEGENMWVKGTPEQAIQNARELQNEVDQLK